MSLNYPLSQHPPPVLQDLDHLLRLDAANVGIEVEDRRQRSERLLAKAGNGELRAVRRKAGDGGAVETVQDAQALQNKVRKRRWLRSRERRVGTYLPWCLRALHTVVLLFGRVFADAMYSV